jgi:hypothetical protein
MATNLSQFSDQQTRDRRWTHVTCDPRTVSGAVWTNCSIECRQQRCDISATSFVNCRFTDCYFGNAPLILESCKFEDCKLIRVTFMYGQLAKSEFRHTTMKECRLRSANLRDSVFDHCRLIKSNIEKADLNGARFVDTDLEQMDFWWWHGYEGAEIPDHQKFKYFIAQDATPRLREAIAAGTMPARIEGFAERLEEIGFGRGEVMLKHEEWDEVITFDDFMAVGRLLT